MKFEMIKGLDEEKFRRLTGVKRTTFDKMVEILGIADKHEKFTFSPAIFGKNLAKPYHQ